MHSIKTFWSPELKKERALRKEESAKYSLINDQLKLLSSENQKQAMLVRQLEEELRMRMRGPSIEMQQQMEALYQENEHLTREIAILRDTIKELELRIETQKQTLQARDESIKKLLEMLQNKGMGKEEERQMFQQMQAMAQKQLDEFRVEIQRRDQEILAMGAKMKTLEEQHQDYQRHIAVLKESLCAKEEHYNMLQTDVEELRQRLEEKNRHIEKKTQQQQQERARAAAEIAELREHMDIKDRKINVLQRKLELHETTKKLQSVGAQRGPEDLSAQKRQLDDERKRNEELKKQLDEQKRATDSKHRQVEEKERALSELDKQLKKRKEHMDQLEISLQKAGGSAAAAGELNKKLAEAEKNLEKSQEESKRSAAEMERLLQLVQMSQEEQNAKEKQIMDLQQALKNAQAKLKSQQQVNAQLEEQRKKEEVRSICVVMNPILMNC
jgi:chromosome segregation ATPase